MTRFDRVPRKTVLGFTVPVATTPRSRLLGLALLDRDSAGEGLLIPRCRSVHTFGMRFELDLVFLDGAGRVVELRRGVPPRRIARCSAAESVLELPVPLLPRSVIGESHRTGEISARRRLIVSVLPEIEDLATVVVCEDDEPTRELLCDHLTADRYRALPAPSASDALRLCGYKQPDLMVLDLGLPDAGGIDVLREIRGADGATGRFDPLLPVIVLSGRGSEADRLRGFAAGADDYLIKPFHYPELAARLGAILRRCASRRAGPLRVGDLVVDSVTRRVRVGDREVELANKEFALLRTLASEPRRVFTKEELLRDVWDFRSAGRTRTLDSHASRLRRKLDPEGSRFVFNCWGVGYRLIEG